MESDLKSRFYTYILRCRDNSLYTGYARDLKDRIAKHNNGKGAKYTRGRLPVELVYFEAHTTKGEAMARESEIKQMSRKKKLALTATKAEDKTPKKPGTLYLCATPLGNLEDISFRAIKTLQECDIVAAEDTRHTIKLLNHFQIKTPLTSYHEHNEKSKGEQLLQQLLEGMNIALVSDAGMPGISDPGAILVKMAVAEGVQVVPIPGPSAGITALVASGLDTGSFVFEGFLSRDKKIKQGQLLNLAGENRTIILYESPHRLKSTLKDVLQVLGDRRVVVARELTKIHEEFIRGNVAELIEEFDQLTIRGEFCLIIEGKSNQEQKKDLPKWEGQELLEQVQKLIKKGLSKKEAIKEVSDMMGRAKREVYNELIRFEGKD